MELQPFRIQASRVRLIALDLDGTLLDDEKRISPRAGAAISALLERGVWVVPSTGRALRGLIDKFPALAGVPYVISSNGALLTECASGRDLFRGLIPPESAAALAADLLDQACNRLYLTTLTTRRVAYRDSRCSAPQGEPPFFTHSGQIDTLDSLQQWLLAERPDILELGIHFFRPDGFAYYQSVVNERHPEINSFMVGPGMMEFTSRSSSKCAALRLLCRHLGLSSGQVCAVGDNGNDLEMLRFAGLGVAMGNALPQVREQADLVIGDNSKDGVADFLEDVFLSAPEP